MRDMPVAKFQRLARYHGFHPEPVLGAFRSLDGSMLVEAVNNGKRGDTAMERVDRRATLLALAEARRDVRAAGTPAGDMSALPVPVEHRAAAAPNNEEAPGVAAPRASI